MPMFYFHQREDDQLIRDPDGSDLPDLETAVVEATWGARSIIGEYIKWGENVPAASLEITDAKDNVLQVVTFWEVLEALIRHTAKQSRENAGR
jgi:hypothetical protein